MKNYNCPICNKSGLEDYREKKIECFGCGSDLSIFVDLKLTSTRYKKLKIAILTTSGISSILIIFLILAFVKTNVILNSSLVRNIELTDSIVIKEKIITLLNDSIKSFQQAKLDSQDRISNYYIVKRGDSFCLISYNLFGTEKYAKDIAELNGKNMSEIIFPNTKLLIPQK